MARFKDANGLEWDLTLSTGMLGKLRTDAQFSLSKQGGAEQLGKLLSDPEAFGKVLWVLVEKQAIARNIEPEAFAFSLDGDALEAATTAIIEAVIDFFQRAGSRQTAKAQLPALMAKADNEMNQAIQAAATEALKTSVGNSAELSASTPAA